MDKLVDLIKSGNIHNIVVLTGAGISVAAGIPDFRSPKIGLYASIKEMKHLKFRNPTFVFDIDVFKNDPRPFWWIFGKLWPRKDWPNPTPFHYFLTLLERHNLLLRCYTQNIDDLETLAGLTADKMVNCHGVLSPCHCLDCHKEVPLSHCIQAIQPNIERDINDYEEAVVPLCPHCNRNHVKPDVVFFGENLPRSFKKYSTDLPQADLMIVAGTSLTVSPVSELPFSLRENVPRFLINKEKVKEKGGKGREFLNNVKEFFTFGLMDYRGVFDFNGQDGFIGGDLQVAALELIQRLGWKEEYEQLKAQAESSQHPLRRITSQD